MRKDCGCSRTEQASQEEKGVARELPPPLSFPAVIIITAIDTVFASGTKQKASL